MNNTEFWLYILVLSGSTYLIRVIPFLAIRNQIQNRFIQSFFTYIPYAVLTAMTIPAIFYATDHPLSALAGLFVSILLALKGYSLTIVAFVSCAFVFLTELILV